LLCCFAISVHLLKQPRPSSTRAAQKKPWMRSNMRRLQTHAMFCLHATSSRYASKIGTTEVKHQFGLHPGFCTGYDPMCTGSNTASIQGSVRDTIPCAQVPIRPPSRVLYGIRSHVHRFQSASIQGSVRDTIPCAQVPIRPPSRVLYGIRSHVHRFQYGLHPGFCTGYDPMCTGSKAPPPRFLYGIRSHVHRTSPRTRTP
jgi:hypothetical protein